MSSMFIYITIWLFAQLIDQFGFRPVEKMQPQVLVQAQTHFF